MYNFDYIINSYESNEEYQSEFLNIFGIDTIESDYMATILDKIWNLINSNNNWTDLLSILGKSFPFEVSLQTLTSMLFTHTNLERSHKCLQEYNKTGNTDLVKDFIKQIE